MDEDIAVIHQHPAGISCAFVVNGFLAQFFQIVGNLFANSIELTCAFAVTNNEVIGEGAYFTDI